jgi:hypothetical protein
LVGKYGDDPHQLAGGVSIFCGYRLFLCCPERPAANKKLGFALAAPCSALFGTMYGSSILLIEKVLAPMHFWCPQPLTALHICGMLTVLTLTAVVNHLPQRWKNTDLWKRCYVKMLSASQSHKRTITTARNEYKF